WRHENHRRVSAGFPHSLSHSVEHRPLQMLRAALARSHAADHIGSVVDRLLGVERALSSSETLHQQACVLIDQDAHRCTASLTTFSAASRMPSATVKLNPDSVRIFRPNSTLVPSIRTTMGTLIFKSRA